jgi:uncharacterized protein (TIGR02145 family)
MKTNKLIALLITKSANLLIITLANLLIITSSFSQVPQKMSYQSVIRNNSGNVVVSGNVSLKISIVQGSISGNAVYVETHTATTNTNGLVSLEIGTGTVVTGVFTEINWANGPYFVKSETDPAGGVNYSMSGVSQLLSVPFALYAGTADSLKNGINETDPQFSSSLAAGINTNDTAKWNEAHTWGNHALQGYLTQEIQVLSVSNDTLFLTGGSFAVIPPGFSGDYNDLFNKPQFADSVSQYADGSETVITGSTNINIDGSGTQANPYQIQFRASPWYLGLDTLGGIVFNIIKMPNGEETIMLVLKQEDSAQWQTTSNLINAGSSWDGVFNTNIMTNSPAKQYCKAFGNEWYLPSIDELKILWVNRYYVNKALNNIGNSVLISDGYYWSSTENGANAAWHMSFTNGTSHSYQIKSSYYRVRPIKTISSYNNTTVSDGDGNTYSTITIGNQIWMSENLRTTKLNDGTSIPLITGQTQWNSTDTFAYCWYNNNTDNQYPYGALYNWYSVNSLKLCPNGWHVPSYNDWDILATFLGGSAGAGGHLKIIGTVFWNSPNTGATNSTGFDAFPGGARNTNGFVHMAISAIWWMSTQSDSSSAHAAAISNYQADLFLSSGNNDKKMGFSIRCIKD